MYKRLMLKFLVLSAVVTVLFSSQVLVTGFPRLIDTQFSSTPAKQPSSVKSAVAGENPNITVSVISNKVTYKPLENVTITANVTNQESYEIDNITVKTTITDAFGDEELYTENETLDSIAAQGNVSVQTVWTALNITMAGFVAEVSVFDNQSVLLASDHWVFDVVEDWTKVPRYGFFSSPAFAPTATGSAEKVEALKLLHVNSLQFYDWFEHHGNYTPTKSTYSMLGHPISRDKVIEIIGLAQNAGMKCMPYTTIYSAAQEIYNQHTDWALTDGPDGPPLKFANWLYYMNPDTPCGWHDYLIEEFNDTIAMFNWDGIHLDQYGWWWTSNAYWNGSWVDMVKAFQHFINDAVGNITQTYPEGKLIFNYVTYWPECYEMMGKNTTVSSLYAEVWNPYNEYSDIRYLIRQGKEYNSSKAVILAAYPTPSPPLPTVLLLDAEIFASQGFHIELGEGNKILTDAYFPDYSTMDEEMIKALRSYYETITRYEQYIYDTSVQELPISTVQVTGYPYGISPSANSIQAIPYIRVVNGSEEARIVHLINFRGVTNMNWKDAKSAPTELSKVPVEVQIPSEKMEEPKGVYLVNPDSLDTDPVPLRFTFNASANTINFSVPSLKYWNIIMIRYVQSGTINPVADAGSDQTVIVDETVTCDASASKPGWNGTHDMPIANYTWDFGDGNTTTVTDPVIYHTYNATGTYTVTLNVSDTAGNWATDTVTITVLAPSDVAVTDIDVFVNPSKYPSLVLSGAYESYPTWGVPYKVNVTVANEGASTVSFNVTLNLQNATGNYTKGTQPVNNLAPGATANLIFSFAVPPLPGYPDNAPAAWPYPTYTVCANASIVSGETDTADNKLFDGTIKVKWPGDATSDGEVKLPDLVKLAKAWYGDIVTNPSKYNYAADFDMNGEIKLSDLVKLAKNWYKGPLD